jgi:hypothetical protein
MFTARRGALAPWLLPLALLLDACGVPGEAVRGCVDDTQCGPGALCVQSACVTNRPPVVTLQLPPAPSTHRVLFLDAIATDPDAGDTISSLAWTITPVGAACQAEPEPSTGARLELVFWCTGTYEVAVVATDRHGSSSAAARQLVDVAPTSGAPVVTAGPGLQVDHACGGTPFACRPATAGHPVSLPLSAAVSDPAGSATAARWRLVPPAGADSRATVTYANGETSLSTEAWLETPGGGIAGSWRFRLRATNQAGLVGQAEQLVEVGNRPPLLTGQPFPIDHLFRDGAYLASGTLALPATDPDGDPLSLTVVLEETGADGCVSHLGPVSGGSVTFDTRCVDPARLIGLATRSLRVSAADGNGAATEASFQIQIGNRPPELRLASNPAGGQVGVGHSVGACPDGSGSCFIAAGSATFAVVDPDGDPVTSPRVAATWAPGLTASMGEATTANGVTTFRFATALAAPAEFRAVDGTSPFSLVATSADPFGASGTLGVPVTISNRPPVLRRASASVTVPHRYDPALQAYVASAPLSAFEDPDGDPLTTEGSRGDASCWHFALAGGEGSVACARGYLPAPGLPPLAGFAGDHALVLQAFDGWEGATQATVVSIQNGAPAGTPLEGLADSCTCTCTRWDADTGTCATSQWRINSTMVPLPVSATDADGDPVQVSYLPAAYGGSERTVFAGDASTWLANPVLPLTVQVSLDDGVSRVQTTSRITGVTCSRLGQSCGL